VRYYRENRELETENERLREEREERRRLLIAGRRLVDEITEIVKLPLRLVEVREWLDKLVARVGRT
jgi:hypothetical protein